MKFVVEVRRIETGSAKRVSHRAVLDALNQEGAKAKADTLLEAWADRGRKTVRVLDARDEEVYRRTI
jgi:hypothetical protein